ncbi:MAG: hypothetical protein ABIR94_07930, partial [Rubrivivax sp.]
MRAALQPSDTVGDGPALDTKAPPVPAQLDEFDNWVRSELAVVESALERWVPGDAPAGLGEAMRYGVLDGGKRL